MSNDELQERGEKTDESYEPPELNVIGKAAELTRGFDDDGSVTDPN